MRQFSWNVFAATGNIEAYLLYKEYELFNKRQDQNSKLLPEDKTDEEAKLM
ncbi:hypothetical protein CathTA2_1806 [Caldalkalibacillus thermarum TA2.A1]|uniref:YqzL family protein n=1 Tax=Caldalkalibacillus thermarum (strain TA2.A1) TaxID=986075 RepID=F5L7K6_CALTT|nr:YqzL family protein [Caldalkalibacillus thermarum]EGL82650.1 hypothetical protein CathTA2_1806 [Caldalkalibacillus thermarum TA2.A1]QZT33368.1 YqzL family protein [Caldalkalibacillus thermarum TA2.A1]GGK18648.1 hypothetical protein GCM10010965_09560 [Caldalkalibacillus thermarum]